MAYTIPDKPLSPTLRRHWRAYMAAAKREDLRRFFKAVDHETIYHTFWITAPEIEKEQWKRKPYGRRAGEIAEG